MELGVFITLGPSAFVKCGGGWAAGDVGEGCVGTCGVYETALVGQEVLPPKGGGKKGPNKLCGYLRRPSL